MMRIFLRKIIGPQLSWLVIFSAVTGAKWHAFLGKSRQQELLHFLKFVILSQNTLWLCLMLSLLYLGAVLVFADHLGSAALIILFLSSEEFASMTLSWAFILYLEPWEVLWDFSLNLFTSEFCINKGTSCKWFKLVSVNNLSRSFRISFVFAFFESV